jgi:uncharacterized membrane protein YjdF
MPVKAMSLTENSPETISPGVSEKGARLRLSAFEVLLAGMVALAMYTGLLLRLPYRSPWLNSLLSGITLATVYGYLRARLQIRLPWQLLACLLFAIVIDMVGNQFGLFSTRIASIPYDTLTHFITSALSLLAVMWLLMRLIRRFGYHLPLGLIAFFSLTTTFSLGAYYEITELLDERFFGGHRIWTTRDTVQDLAADLAGIILAAVCYTLAIRRSWPDGATSVQPETPG